MTPVLAIIDQGDSAILQSMSRKQQLDVLEAIIMCPPSRDALEWAAQIYLDLAYPAKETEFLWRI